MTNYNDGKWHGWNGGECPVHPESVVETRHLKFGEIDDSTSWSHENTVSAGWFNKKVWLGVSDSDINPIIAFRVVKEHKEPREYWIFNGVTGYCVLESEPKDKSKVIHVREVLE